jgi:RimJ/RimL family protein N-acetyltransferase
MPGMAAWGERGFPYQAFDLGYLRDPDRARRVFHWVQTDLRHRHFVACEGDMPVGRFSLNLEDPAGLYIWAVHVPPEHEGRGVCRRMLRVLLDWLGDIAPATDVVLTTNTFAVAAHRAYYAIGFETVETRWQYDAELSRELWRRPRQETLPIASHMRFSNGRWEVRTYLMRYRANGEG